MKSISIVGINYENRQEVLEEVIDSFEGQLPQIVIKLEKEPDNPHDPNTIKVMMFDSYGDSHHVGYIPKDETKYVHDNFNLIKRIDVDVSDGLTIHLHSVVDNNPFLQQGDGSNKTKIINRIGCGILLFIVLMIIIIILT